MKVKGLSKAEDSYELILSRNVPVLASIRITLKNKKELNQTGKELETHHLTEKPSSSQWKTHTTKKKL
jgi:hypothetical protein